MRSARSASFLIPAKIIFVPGMYFLGLIKYSYMCFSDQTIPEDLLASEYGKPSVVPDGFPKIPYRLGPCFAAPPASIVWHCAHLALNSLAPCFTFPSGTVTSGSARDMAAKKAVEGN